MKFRKKPIVIEAVEFRDTTESMCELSEFLGTARFSVPRAGITTLIIPTLEGDLTAVPGDWVIRGVKGEFYPCKPDIFAATYEPVE
jgi:hypothetical protein